MSPKSKRVSKVLDDLVPGQMGIRPQHRAWYFDDGRTVLRDGDVFMVKITKATALGRAFWEKVLLLSGGTGALEEKILMDWIKNGDNSDLGRLANVAFQQYEKRGPDAGA